jgi:hypothetical protein
MPSPSLSCLAVLVLAARPPSGAQPAQLQQARPSRTLTPVPTTARPPVVDGQLDDLTPSLELKLPPRPRGASAELGAKVAFHRGTLFLGVKVTDDVLLTDDRFSVTLYFPGAGALARGYDYHFDGHGRRVVLADGSAPSFAQGLVHVATRPLPKGYALELALPARSLPRFPAFDPLMLSLCLRYTDVDSGAAPTGFAEAGTAGPGTQELTNCPSTEMQGGPLRLPDDLRQAVGATPPRTAVAIEARATGWVAFSNLTYPLWARADAPLTPASLADLVATGEAIAPASVALPIPPEFRLPNGEPALTVLTGKNPFRDEGCLPERELRLALYAVGGSTALRVLEWPVATCALGRAMRFDFESDGVATLAIAYTSGGTAHFAWVDDHFERAELGARERETPR